MISDFQVTVEVADIEGRVPHRAPAFAGPSHLLREWTR